MFKPFSILIFVISIHKQYAYLMCFSIYFLVQVVVEARDRASSGQANSAQTTIIVEVSPGTDKLTTLTQ